MGRKVYNQEFKAEAVELANRKGLKKAAEDLGVSPVTLRRWQSEEKNPKAITLEESEKENARLRKENEYLKKINEVLKKSHGIFVKDHLTNSKS